MKAALFRFGVLFACLAVPAFAQTRVVAFQNNYSYLLPDDPNYGIARGSIFIIYGENLSNTTTGLQSSTEPPFLQTTLEGVSAQVTVDGVTTNVIWYYLTPGQLGGILPSATPAGDGTLVVNNNGQVSNAAPIHVVDSAFGVLALDGTGAGPAAAYDLNYQFLGPNNSAQPGDVIQLFGTGLGPTTDIETMQVPAVNLTNLPITVEVAGTPATVLFRGRIFPGLDQINILIPDLVLVAGGQKGAFTQFGCNIPINVQTGDLGSNVTTIPISADGGVCPPSSPGGLGSTSDLTISQAEIDQWTAAGVYRQGSIALTRQSTYTITDDIITSTTTTNLLTSDVLSASFNAITGPDLPNLFTTSLPGVFSPTAGECAVTLGVPANPVPNLFFESLDAGPSVAAMGPNGTRIAHRMTVVSAGTTYFYGETIGAGIPGDFLDPGTYLLSGPGGPDVGAYSGDLRIAPDLVWTNRADAVIVDRSQPLIVTWTGGEPTTLVFVQGTSSVLNNGDLTVASFTCWANNPDGQLTVQADILGQLPASGRIQAGGLNILQRGTLAVASVGTGVRMFADGIDYLTGGNQWGIATSTEYR